MDPSDDNESLDTDTDLIPAFNSLATEDTHTMPSYPDFGFIGTLVVCRAGTVGKTLWASLDTLRHTCSTDHSTDQHGGFGCGGFGCGGRGTHEGCGRGCGNQNISFSSSVAHGFDDHVFAMDDIDTPSTQEELTFKDLKSPLLTLRQQTILLWLHWLHHLPLFISILVLLQTSP